jgi:Raf kinase inhibitor-like YbhB/YbcL family protein
MRKQVGIFSLIMVIFLLPALVTVVGGAAMMTLESAAFPNGGEIPIKYTWWGAEPLQNYSIPLQWQGPPVGTQSFALSMVDQHPMANNFVHWLVINIPPDCLSLAEGASYPNYAMPAGSRQLQNSWHVALYGGPDPPPETGAHPYVVTVYALNVASLDLPDNATLAAFQAAIADKTLASATITGYFGSSTAGARSLLLPD